MVSDLISVADTAPPNQHLQTYAFAQLLRQGYIVANYLKVDRHKEIRPAEWQIYGKHPQRHIMKTLENMEKLPESNSNSFLFIMK